MNENQIHPLQQARKKLGIRQKVLADLTGLSEPTIKRAESGKPLDDYTISAICEYFAMRYGRQVKPEELGLRAKWEREEILLNDASVPEENDSEEDIERDPPKGSRQISVNLLKSEDTFFIPPQHELLLKTGTKDWTVWASMKLMPIFTLIGSIGGQDHASEEVCEEIQTLLDQEIKMLDDMIPQARLYPKTILIMQ
jgi:transcriptional regulator with XRE-family HTH domain